MERPSGSMQKHLATLGVIAQAAKGELGVEALALQGQSLDEIRVISHRLPTRGALVTGLTGQGRPKNYYELRCIARGYPFHLTEAQKRAGAWLSKVLGRALLAGVAGLVLLGFLRLFLDVESNVMQVLLWAVLAGTVLVAFVVLLRSSWVDRNWKAHTDRLTQGGFKWQGGAIARVLNQEAKLNTALTSEKKMKIYVIPNRKLGVVEIRAGLFDSVQEAVPTREAFDAYDAIARHLRQLSRTPSP